MKNNNQPKCPHGLLIDYDCDYCDEPQPELQPEVEGEEKVDLIKEITSDMADAYIKGEQGEESWEKEFLDKFWDEKHSSLYFLADADEMINFIRNLLAQERKKERERVLKEKFLKIYSWSAQNGFSDKKSYFELKELLK